MKKTNQQKPFSKGQKTSLVKQTVLPRWEPLSTEKIVLFFFLNLSVVYFFKLSLLVFKAPKIFPWEIDRNAKKFIRQNGGGPGLRGLAAPILKCMPQLGQESFILEGSCPTPEEHGGHASLLLLGFFICHWTLG